MPDHESRTLFTWRSLPAGVAMLAVVVVILRLEGRIAWHTDGLGLWSAAWTNTTSQHFVDPYTLSHFLHGVIFYWALRPLKLALHWRLIVALGLELAWELLENSPPIIERYRAQTASLDYAGDSILNSLGDVLACVAGFAFASHLPLLALLSGLVVVGTWIGSRLLDRVSERTFVRLYRAVLTVIALRLVLGEGLRLAGWR